MIDQTKVFTPMLIPFTPGLAEDVEVNVPLPATTAHIPVPIAGTFPFKEDEVEQIVESNPAFATVGNGSIMKSTVSEEIGQVPFVIVQAKVFIPILIPVIPELEEVAEVKLDVPVTTVHIPVPIRGIFPFKDDELEQILESMPASATVGNGSTKIVIVSVELIQIPFEIVQTNVFVPMLNPVTPEVGEAGEVIVAAPAITVHIPVPTVGIFPLSDEVEEHIV